LPPSRVHSPQDREVLGHLARPRRSWGFSLRAPGSSRPTTTVPSKPPSHQTPRSNSRASSTSRSRRQALYPRRHAPRHQRVGLRDGQAPSDGRSGAAWVAEKEAMRATPAPRTRAIKQAGTVPMPADTGPGRPTSQDLGQTRAQRLGRSRGPLRRSGKPQFQLGWAFAPHRALNRPPFEQPPHRVANAQMASNANRSPVAGGRVQSGTRGRNRAQHGTAGQTGALIKGRVSGDRRRRRRHGRLGSAAVLNTTTSGVRATPPQARVSRGLNSDPNLGSPRLDPERNHQGIQNQLLGPAPPASRGRVLRRCRLGRILHYDYRRAASCSLAVYQRFQVG
jgi:hypothetical protein